MVVVVEGHRAAASSMGGLEGESGRVVMVVSVGGGSCGGVCGMRKLRVESGGGNDGYEGVLACLVRGGAGSGW